MNTLSLSKTLCVASVYSAEWVTGRSALMWGVRCRTMCGNEERPHKMSIVFLVLDATRSLRFVVRVAGRLQSMVLHGRREGVNLAPDRRLPNSNLKVNSWSNFIGTQYRQWTNNWSHEATETNVAMYFKAKDLNKYHPLSCNYFYCLWNSRCIVIAHD